MHLELEQIERLLHGEADEVAREHAERCEPCRMRVREAAREEAEIFGLLAAVDDPRPVLSAAALIERAARRRRVSWAWAAGIVLALGTAVAAAAVPGSPIRAWLAKLSQHEARDPRVQTAPQGPGSAGIAVPAGNRLLIEIEPAQDGATLQVRLIDGGDVITVTASSASAVFTSGTDRLLISNPSRTGDFDIRIPRTSHYVSITGDRRLFLKDGAQVSAEVQPDAEGVYRFHLSSNAVR